MFKPLILIDGSSYLHRAFHALPPLTNSQGEPTGAVFGVLNMIRKLIKEYEPKYIAVVFDTKGKTFRSKLYPAYKANRPPMSDDLQAQIKPLYQVIQAMGLPLLMKEGVEADDIIGTLAHQAVKQGMTVLISTGDKDMAQLVNDKITLINTMSNVILDQKTVKEKFGVLPEQIVDYLALIGDSSDNVPGVPKVGPKTAAKWLQDYGDLDHIVHNADGLNGKIGDNLRKGLEQLAISKRLVTIKRDVKLAVQPNELSPSLPDKKKLIEWLQRLEFRQWLSELLQNQPCNTGSEKKYQTILDQSDFNKWLTRLKKTKVFALDTETTSLDAINAEIVGISFSIKKNEAAYIPLAHDYKEAPKQLKRDEVLKQLQPLLNDQSKTIIGHNLKYDINVLLNHDITIKTSMIDTLLESYVLNSASNRHDMDTLALKYLNVKTIRFEDIAGKGAKQLTFNQIPLERAAIYAAEDADVTLQLHEFLHSKLKEDKKLLTLLKTIEEPVMPVLAEIERNGVLIDAKKLEQQSKALAERIHQLENKAYQLAGEVFNLASPKQLQAILYDKGKIPVIYKTPAGAPSTAEPVLQELALNYPLPQIILEFRTLSKLKTTYTDTLPAQINPETGRIHTSYNQAVTATGRLSSTHPNLQNIPTRTAEGRQIRQAFIAPKGYKILSADYSQIELRIMAHLSRDAGLLKAFEKNLDIHRATASEVFGVKLDVVTVEQRRSAKAINFGLIYGMSAFGLSQQLGIARNLAQQYMDLYFARYPGVKKYMEETRKLAHQQGYVETLYGRRLYLPEINSRNLTRQRAAERAAINAPMQGTAADIIKLAMIKISHWLHRSKVDAKMIMQVHDELVFEVVTKEANKVASELKALMEKVEILSVPIEIHIGIGDHWDAAH